METTIEMGERSNQSANSSIFDRGRMQSEHWGECWHVSHGSTLVELQARKLNFLTIMPFSF